MSSLAHTALAASIVLSALGAVVICLLTAMFGFTPPSEEPPAQATRRLFLTRVGHAVAAACFAGTAILLAVVLGQPARTTSAAGGAAGRRGRVAQGRRAAGGLPGAGALAVPRAEGVAPGARATLVA